MRQPGPAYVKLAGDTGRDRIHVAVQHVEARVRNRTADRDRGGGDMTEAAHAQLGQRETRGESSGGGNSCIEDARSTRKRVNRDTQFGGPGGHLIGQPPCPFVHSKIWHGRELYVSWNGDISNEP